MEKFIRQWNLVKVLFLFHVYFRYDRKKECLVFFPVFFHRQEVRLIVAFSYLFFFLIYCLRLYNFL